MSLEYREFNNHNLIVFCEIRNKYEEFFETIGGKWFSGNDEEKKTGFINPKENKRHLLKILEMIKIRENAKSRKNQNKYHRAVSDSEDDSDDEESEHDVKEFNENKKKYRRSDPKKYYKSFNNKPVDFKKINRIESDEESDEYSSSSHGSSSSDGFPSPGTPRRRRNYNIDDLLDTIEDLTERVKYLEKKNKK